MRAELLVLDPVVAGLIWLGLGTSALGLTGLLILEGVLYLARRPLITEYVRSWKWQHLYLAVAIGLALVAGAAAAFTHFVLDGGRP